MIVEYSWLLDTVTLSLTFVSEVVSLQFHFCMFIHQNTDCRLSFTSISASIVDPLHLDYFSFCGRVIALALMHKVQIGIVFDRIFFLQLAGKHVSLDDVRDADPCLFNSCKKILEMDAGLLDSDVLGLTFVREVEELGSRRIVELCPGGKDIIVNSTNRQNYVDLMIQHCFVTCISEQVDRFSQGFGDILSDSKFRKLFFSSLELEDFDRMLGGSDGTICIKDWKRHTEYKGYKASDRQISWFWKVELLSCWRFFIIFCVYPSFVVFLTSFISIKPMIVSLFLYWGCCC